MNKCNFLEVIKAWIVESGNPVIGILRITPEICIIYAARDLQMFALFMTLRVTLRATLRGSYSWNIPVAEIMMLGSREYMYLRLLVYLYLRQRPQ